MSIFYINAEKNIDGQEWLDKYDLGKFIDGTSDVPEDTKQRVRLAVNMNATVEAHSEGNNAGTIIRLR